MSLAINQDEHNVTNAVIDIKKLAGKRDEIKDMVARAQVTNDDEQQKANDLLKIIKVARKKADDERKEAGEWFRAKVNEINSKYNTEVIKPLDQYKNDLEAKIKPYTLKKLKEQKEAERKRREELEAQALEQASEAEKHGDQQEANEIIETAAKASQRLVKPSTVRSDYGAVTSASIIYDYEITDLSLIPRDYLVVDESKIRKAINGDNRVKEIPGIKIIEDVRITSR